MSKMNAKGREKHSRFLSVTHRIYDSLAFKMLTQNAKVVYLEMRRRFNGFNNGQISLSVREASKAIKYDASAGASGQRALQELIKHGFIKTHNKGHYGNRHATTWILTSETFEERAPTNEWKDYSEKLCSTTHGT